MPNIFQRQIEGVDRQRIPQIFVLLHLGYKLRGYPGSSEHLPPFMLQEETYVSNEDDCDYDWKQRLEAVLNSMSVGGCLANKTDEELLALKADCARPITRTSRIYQIALNLLPTIEWCLQRKEKEIQLEEEDEEEDYDIEEDEDEYDCDEDDDEDDDE